MIKKFFSQRNSLIGFTAVAVLMSASAASAQTNPVENIQPISSSRFEVLPLSPSSEPLQSDLLQLRSEPLQLQSAPLRQSEPTATEPSVESSPQLAQTTVAPGRRTRSGPSYVGIGGNIGLGGDTALGDSGFAVISKIGLTRNFSGRPSLVIGGDDPTILLPVTVDFPISSVAEAGEVNLRAAPYIGGGIAISTGSNSLIRPLISAGIDVPVASRITATAGVNFAFFDDTEIGLILGAGYTF